MLRVSLAASLFCMIALPMYADITFTTTGAFDAAGTSPLGPTWTFASNPGESVTFTGITNTIFGSDPYDGSLGTLTLKWASGSSTTSTNEFDNLNLTFDLTAPPSLGPETLADNITAKLVQSSDSVTVTVAQVPSPLPVFAVIGGEKYEYDVAITGLSGLLSAKSSTPTMSADIEGEVTVTDVGHVPEPGTVALLGVFGVVGFAFSRRRRSV